MPVKVYEFSNDVFVDISDDLGLDKSNGLYNVLKIVDVNNDSFKDIILGNYGLNSSFEASIDKPLTLLVNDFDNNRKTEQIIGMYYGNDLYPIVQLKDLWMQIPVLKKKYLKFENYKNKKLIEYHVAQVTSQISKDPHLRKLVFNFQKKIAYNIPQGYSGSILNGRDITHRIIPDATFKFYVTASIFERSRRRTAELKKLGKNVTFKEVFKSLKKRDKSDKNRRYSPLKLGPDSLLINSTRLSITECFLKVKKIIDRRLNNYARNFKTRQK